MAIGLADAPKVKFYSSDGQLLSEPELILPSLDMDVADAEGYLELPMNGYANPWFYIQYVFSVPSNTYNVLLHWKLMGYAYSDEAQTASLNIIAPSHYTELW